MNKIEYLYLNYLNKKISKIRRNFYERLINPIVKARLKTLERNFLSEYFPLLQSNTYRSNTIKSLLPVYQYYIKHVSNPVMTVSLETASTLFIICEYIAPSRILDLGSGFSSYVFRKYSSLQNGKVTVYSIDDDSYWLGMTRDFLKYQNLSSNNLILWKSFISNEYHHFDLIFNDIGTMVFREKVLPMVLGFANPKRNVIILDDMQFSTYEKRVKQVLQNFYFRSANLISTTKDEFGRFSALLINVFPK